MHNVFIEEICYTCGKFLQKGLLYNGQKNYFYYLMSKICLPILNLKTGISKV